MEKKKNDDSGEKVLQNQTLKGKESAEEEGESVWGGGGASEWDGEGVRTGRGPEASYQMSTHSLEALAEPSAR